MDSKYVAIEVFFEHPYLSVAQGRQVCFFFFFALEQEMQNSNRKSDIEGLRTSVFSLSVVL